MKTKITIEDLDRWGACCRDDGERYSNENLKKLMKNKASISVDEALKLKIPVVDKLWLVLREELISKEKLLELGHIFAKRAVKKHCLNCGIAKVEDWANEYRMPQWDAARDAEFKWQVKQVKRILKN